MSSKLILLLNFLLIASSYAQALDPSTTENVNQPSLRKEAAEVTKNEDDAESDKPTQQSEGTGSNAEESINQVQMNPSQTSREDIVLIYSEEKKHFIDSNNKKANLLELISEKKNSITVLLESENYEKIGILFELKKQDKLKNTVRVTMRSFDEKFQKKYSTIIFFINIKDSVEFNNQLVVESFHELIKNDPRGDYLHFSDKQMIGILSFAAIGAVVVLRFALIPTAVITGVAGISYLIYKTVKKIYFNESEKGEENISIDDIVGNLETKA